MAKNHHNFRLIKKAFKSIAFMSTLMFIHITNTAFAVPPATKESNTTDQIRQIKSRASYIQIKEYIDKLRNEELCKLYKAIYQRTFRKPHSLKLMYAREAISATQAQREASKIEHLPRTFRLQRQMDFSLTRPIKFTSKTKGPHSKPRQPKLPKIQKDSSSATTNPTCSKMRECEYCKRPCPFFLKSRIGICEDCQKEIVGYVCQVCRSNIVAGTIPNNKTTTRKKCPECEKSAKAAELLSKLRHGKIN